jgi:hypothetical protein
METFIKLKPIKASVLHLLMFQLLLFLSCNSNNHKNSQTTKNAVSNFVSDTIILPKSKKILLKDSLYNKETLLDNKAKLKITTLLWGECHSCIADLNKWKDFYHFIDKKDNIEILFYLYTSDLNLFRQNLYKKAIRKYPFIIDRKNRYLNKNDLPFKNKVYQTFLLDSNNRVILVGNPIYSEKLMKLYKEEINKRLD